jgi:hypothetical protein
MTGEHRRSGRPDRLLLVSSLALALAPKCPLCLLAYAGFLGSSVSLAWSVHSTYNQWLEPLTVVCLGLSVGGLAVRARHRREIWPAVLALAAATAIYAGKFQLDQKPFVYAGMAALAGAAVWASWPRRSPGACHCPPIF